MRRGQAQVLVDLEVSSGLCLRRYSKVTGGKLAWEGLGSLAGRFLGV